MEIPGFKFVKSKTKLAIRKGYFLILSYKIHIFMNWIKFCNCFCLGVVHPWSPVCLHPWSPGFLHPWSPGCLCPWSPGCLHPLFVSTKNKEDIWHCRKMWDWTGFSFHFFLVWLKKYTHAFFSRVWRRWNRKGDFYV